MKSRASFKGHPLHPILVAFPIAFLIGAFVFDALSVLNNTESFWQTGKYLAIAGIVSALVAAVPGIIDYYAVVPPKSSGKKRATQHGLLNVTVVIVFAIALYVRGDSVTPVLILEGAGVILLFVSGWLGGTLVYRNQIGVDPRYANAGKWKEAYFDQSVGSIEVAAADELNIDQMKLLHVSGKRIVLAKTENAYVAFDDRCTHRGASLAGGMMICGTVQCPWHGSQFNCTTGEVKAGPAKEGISTYTVNESGGKVFLVL